MNTKLTLSLGAVALTTMLAAAPQASAQSAAVADFEGAVAKTRAFTAASNTIKTTYATQIAQADQMQRDMQTLLAPYDTNKDKRIDDTELQAAQSTPGWQAIVTKQQQIQTVQLPVLRAQAYVVEQISAKIDVATQNVIAARGTTILIKPEAVAWANQVSNITPAITAELDKLVPSVNAIPPASWQPGQTGAAAPAAGAPAPTTTAPAPTTGTPRRTR